MNSAALAPSLATPATAGQPRTAPAWTIIAGIIALDWVWSAQADLAIHGIAMPALACLGLLSLSAAYRRRSSSIAASTEAAALWVAFTAAACALTYLCASIARPLQDAALAAADTALGFDWWAWHNVVLNHPPLHLLLTAAYASLLPQIVLSIIYLPAIGRADRNSELLLLAALTLLPTAAISALWPALGTLPNAVHVPDFLALRAPGPWSFDLSAMQGIITMPSYHTVLAVLFAYAFRGTGPIGWSIAALNLLMLPSIPPMGAHYLVDLFAGAAFAITAIVAARGCNHLLHRPRRGDRFPSYSSLPAPAKARRSRGSRAPTTSPPPSEGLEVRKTYQENPVSLKAD